MVDPIKIRKVIELHYSDKNCKFPDIGISYEEFEWNEEDPKPTEEQIESLYDEWVDSIHLSQHIETRKSQYPSTDELIVALWEKLVEQDGLSSELIDSLQARRIVVKESIPKLLEKPVKEGQAYPDE